VTSGVGRRGSRGGPTRGAWGIRSAGFPFALFLRAPLAGSSLM
jgi:hypothetical protein